MPGQQPWQVLSVLPAWQVTQLPRPPGREQRPDGGARDDGAARRAAELVSAYCRSATVAVAWLRERASGPVRVITAGVGLSVGCDNGQDVLALPSGARGQRLPDDHAAQLLAAIPCWNELAGVCDVLLADQDTPGLSSAGRDGGDAARPSLEDGLLSAWLGPFAWLLLAEPVDGATLEKMTSEVALEQLTAQRNDSPRAKLAERRTAARHAELRQAASTGLWRVHMLAGAMTPEQAAQVAGLLRASADLGGLPYGLLPARPAAPPPGRDHAPARAARPSMLDDPSLRWAVTAERERTAMLNSYQRAPAPTAPPSAEERWPAPQPAAPFYASTALVAALARLPAREVPGLRMVLRPEFDLTPETTPHSGDETDAHAVRLGDVLDWNRVPCGSLAVPRSSLNRHVLVTGATGAGKSQTIRGLLEQVMSAGIPWLVIEPAKAEYRLMAARLPAVEVIRIRPGDLDGPPAGINPLEPAAGPDRSRFPLQTHADLLRALFLAAFRADEPFPQVLSAALSRCYEQAGWDLVTGQPATPGVLPAYPSLGDLQAAAIAVVNEIGYGREVADNVRGFVTVRIGSLRLGTTGRFLDGGHPLDFGKLLKHNVVLEIEDAGDDHDKAFLMGAVLIRLIEHLRLRQRREEPGGRRLRHLTVVEEAHRLLRQSPPAANVGAASHATEMFADLLAEIRAYGEGLVIAEQIPAKLIPDAIKNTAVKIVHRLPALDDREAVGATMNLTGTQSEYLVTLVPGEAAVHADGWDYPLLARMPDGTAREAASPAITASAGPVITRRSATCGTACMAKPCTLGQMRAAQRATITDPRLTLWAELSVVAHLTGWDMPRPAPVFTASLRSMGDRLRDCALSHAADAAVAARIPAISTRVSPEALAVHVTAVMRQALTAGTRACDTEEPRYLAPPYRWSLVRDALRAACRSPGAGPHPRSAEWERTYGQPVPGATSKAQFSAVSRWYLRDQRDSRAITTILWGSRSHSAIEQSVGTRVGSGDWLAQFGEALDAFTRLRWPRNLLRDTPSRTPQAPKSPAPPMSELYGTSETAEPASEAGAASWYETSSGQESVDSSRSELDAAQGEAYVGEGDYGSYSDADLEAMLAAEERLPESRTRQEAAADTWDDTTDDAAGSELATEYDDDVGALLTEEERLPESRTRQEAAAGTWNDTPDPGNDDPGSFSGDPTSEYDGDAEALLAEEEHQPEPRTRQEAAADTWRGTASDQHADLDANADNANLSELSARQATEETGPDSRPLIAGLAQPDAVTAPAAAPDQTDEAEHGAPEPDTRQVAVHSQDGREVPITVEHLPPEARTVGDDTPTGVGLKPTGDQLLRMENDSKSPLEKLRAAIYERADDINDVGDEYGGDLERLFDRPPTETHTEVQNSHPDMPSQQHHAIDGGHVATVGFVVGVLGFELFRAARSRVERWRER